LLNKAIAESVRVNSKTANHDTNDQSWRVSPEIEASASRVGLTPRERQILALVDQGLSTKSIAKELGRSPATIKSHIQAILAKYNVHRRSEAAAIFRRNLTEEDSPNRSSASKKY